MESIVDIILLFFTFSLAGWCIEVILKYRQFHRIINRGFLMGPCLPIYGSGAVLVTLSVRALAGLEASVGTTFVVAFFVCGLVEYFASYYMERKFHARWWDYSTKPMNLNGRVWIGNLILFGLAGVLTIHFINPFIFGFYHLVNLGIREIISVCLILLFSADFTMSHFVMKLLKHSVEKSEADNTEEISKEVRLILSDKNVFYRRFAEAYPEVIYRTEKVKQRMEEIRVETEKLRKEAEMRMDQLNNKLEEEKSKLVYELEPTSQITTGIIEKQSELITLLYSKDQENQEIRDLMDEIDKQKSRLENRQNGLAHFLHV